MPKLRSTVVSVLPVLVLAGVSGDFVKPLALTYGLAVLVSMLVALIVTPALAAALLSGSPQARRESPVARLLTDGYTSLLRGVARVPVLALGATAIIIVGGLVVLPQLDGAQLIPELKDRDIVVRMKAAAGTSLPAMAASAGNS